MRNVFQTRYTRRSALQTLGAITGISLSLSVDRLQNIVEAATNATSNPIKHVLVACQENRTFDEYFGFYPKAGKYGVPAGFSQPDGKGGKVYPYHFPVPVSNDVTHSWQTIHSEWDNGKMDGFYTTDGLGAMGYYNASDLPFYYSLANAFTLCGNYYCYQLGPTTPNRLALWSGTSGGQTTNNINGGQLDWPTIVDVLDAHKITWKCYNLGIGTGSQPTQAEGYNGLAYFKKWVNDPRLYLQEADYYTDLKAGTLPQVSFFITESLISEHPPADIQLGQQKIKDITVALIKSSSWESSTLFITYDEGGGYFDHVAPPQVDAYGLGLRVPTLVVSPYAKRGYLAGHLAEHSSILKFIERRFNLPTLASVNHQFDAQTPGAGNDAANGQTYGPPAPPRDKLTTISDMYGMFDFTQNPNYFPPLG